ncbi:MAG: FAD-dependent oxidoreductase [Acidimicrobiales bacterium]
MSDERVVIVGGGVVGTMHALEACQRGWDVVHLEADAAPRHASVRNFGLVWVSGRAAGPELELALRSRVLWQQLASYAPEIGFRSDGSLTIATNEDELSLMDDLARQPEAAQRKLEVVDADGVKKLNPAVRGITTGGLYCRRDAIIEPGSVLEALRRTLEETGHYWWIPGRRVVDVLGDTGTGGPAAVDHLGGSYTASLVLLCIGDQYAGLGGRIGATLATAPLRRCRLQMMETAASTEPVSTAIADADTMRYYPAYDLPGRSALPPPRRETTEQGMQLLLVQRASGGLTIGDTHEFDEPFDFAVDETVYERLRERAESILGWRLPHVVRRWSGVYSIPTDDRLYYRHWIDHGICVVTGPAGRGMTLAPAIAEETWVEATA